MENTEQQDAYVFATKKGYFLTSLSKDYKSNDVYFAKDLLDLAPIIKSKNYGIDAGPPPYLDTSVVKARSLGYYEVIVLRDTLATVKPTSGLESKIKSMPLSEFIEEYREEPIEPSFFGSVLTTLTSIIKF